MLEGDLRAPQVTHLGSSALVAGFPDEMARQSTGYSCEWERSTASSCSGCG